ncbi:hypothetical protein VP01_2344g1 [Puccinia sorghi]|uniref:Uncharacterized protein n=1 Tax=Puccinia sorghi TaxID=27349 RepID=A0A0L6V815_9BASI|nr:hypothetical protein VP01_2344g1 [Puccinia sorghi]
MTLRLADFQSGRVHHKYETEVQKYFDLQNLGVPGFSVILCSFSLSPCQMNSCKKCSQSSVNFLSLTCHTLCKDTYSKLILISPLLLILLNSTLPSLLLSSSPFLFLLLYLIINHQIIKIHYPPGQIFLTIQCFLNLTDPFLWSIFILFFFSFLILFIIISFHFLISLILVFTGHTSHLQTATHCDFFPNQQPHYDIFIHGSLNQWSLLLVSREGTPPQPLWIHLKRHPIFVSCVGIHVNLLDVSPFFTSQWKCFLERCLKTGWIVHIMWNFEFVVLKCVSGIIDSVRGNLLKYLNFGKLFSSFIREGNSDFMFYSFTQGRSNNLGSDSVTPQEFWKSLNEYSGQTMMMEGDIQ